MKKKIFDFIDNLSQQSKNYIAFFFFFTFWVTVLLYSETFPAGFHLGDDYEIIKFHTSVEKSGTYSSIKDYILEDLNVRSRYRPVFSINRALAMSVFDLNFSLILAYFCFLGILTSYFLYKFCITIKFSFIQSILFSLTTLIGNASVIWIETSDAENIGMLFLSLSLFFMSKAVYEEKYRLIYYSFFYFFLILMSASKESFILVIPAIIFLYLWIYSNKFQINIRQTIKENKLSLIILFLIFVFSLLLIKIFVLNNAPKYTGVDIKILSFSVLKGFFSEILSLIITYLIILGILIFSIYTLYKNQIKGIKNVISELNKKYGFITITFLLITIPQYLNYYKSTLLNRYYLPFLLGFSLYLVYLNNQIDKAQYISKLVKYLFTVLIIVFVFFELKNVTIKDFKHSSNDAKMVKNLVGSVTDKINKDSTILIVIDPVQNIQPCRALLYYLRDIKEYSKVKVRFTKRNDVHKIYSDTTFYNNMLNISSRMFRNESFDSLKNKNEINGVVILWGLEENFLKENNNWFKTEDFNRYQFGIYRLYTKK